MTELVTTNGTALLGALREHGVYDHGLKLKDPNITYEKFEAIGRLMGREHTDLRLAMGDYLVIAEQKFPEQFSQAAEALNISEDGLMEYMRVSRAVPHKVRLKNPRRVSWSHYRAVSSMKQVDSETGEVTVDHAAQREWLERAETQDWSHHKLRAELKPAPAEPPARCECCGRTL